MACQRIRKSNTEHGLCPIGAYSLVGKRSCPNTNRMTIYSDLPGTVQNARFPSEIINSVVFTLKSVPVGDANDIVILHISPE